MTEQAGERWHDPWVDPQLDAVAVCRHPDGHEHPAPITDDGFPVTCHAYRELGGHLRWIVVDHGDPPDGGL